MERWLKYGLIVAILDIILIIIELITTESDAALMGLHYLQIPFTLLAQPFIDNWFQSFTPLIIGGLITWFAVGALIGLIVNLVANKITSK